MPLRAWIWRVGRSTIAYRVYSRLMRRRLCVRGATKSLKCVSVKVRHIGSIFIWHTARWMGHIRLTRITRLSTTCVYHRMHVCFHKYLYIYSLSRITYVPNDDDDGTERHTLGIFLLIYANSRASGSRNI